MSKCKDCTFYFAIPESAGDHEPGKGDCVTPEEDVKGRYWLSRPTVDSAASCSRFEKSEESA